MKDVTFPDGRARVSMRLPPRHFENVRREGGLLLDEDGRPIPETDRFGKPKAERRPGRAGAEPPEE